MPWTQQNGHCCLSGLEISFLHSSHAEFVQRLEDENNDLIQTLFQWFSNNMCCGIAPWNLCSNLVKRCKRRRNRQHNHYDDGNDKPMTPTKGCCWCQCLGICALAQEAREIQSLIPSKDLQIDYLTHEPWGHYTPKLRAVRDEINQQMEYERQRYEDSDEQSNPRKMKRKRPKVIFSIPRLVKQYKAMSKCGKYIWIGFIGLTMGIVMMCICSPSFHFGWGHFGVLLATFGQSFFVLYLVHRLYTKSYLSLDAITKCFAAGFILAVPTAFVLEMILVNTLLLIVFMTLLIFKLLGGGALVVFLKSHSMGFGILYEIFNAFVVAALTEELCKYYIFRMMEHPDLMFMRKQTPEAVSGQLRRIVEGRSSASVTSTSDEEEDCTNVHLEGITHRQKAAAVTIAMLSVALGLACAENVLYVFYLGGQNGNKASEEFATLVMRSIFPIHALCAAMQSLSVIKKYVEYDPSQNPADVQLWTDRKRIGVGKTIFPAVVLHGCFDVVLMIVSLFATDSSGNDGSNYNGENEEGYYYNSGEEGYNDSDAATNELPWWINLFTWCFVIFITVMGFIWYMKQKFRQRLRLMSLDEQHNLINPNSSISFDEQFVSSPKTTPTTELV